MNLVPMRRMESQDPIRQFEREIGQVIQRLFHEGSDGSGQNGLTAWLPRVDIEEDEKQYTVKADLPGVEPDEVDISVADNTLTIRGQKTEEREENKKDYHRIERFEGQFYRQIPLPRDIDADKIQARSANGVLTVVIPKTAEAQPKKIAVQADTGRTGSGRSATGRAGPDQTNAGQTNPAQSKTGQARTGQTAQTGTSQSEKGQ